jgi:hypothetical protein
VTWRRNAREDVDSQILRIIMSSGKSVEGDSRGAALQKIGKDKTLLEVLMLFSS